MGVWQQYVHYLRVRKLSGMKIPHVIKSLFRDEAFNGYSMRERIRQKRPFKSYVIFVDCMLDVWQEMSTDKLVEIVMDVIRKTRQRSAKRQYRAKKALEEEKQITV
ncbi:uncharacterized protein LOC128732815 [Sabethes cyaneus]|uniref:uncharacterized protein LOC128732815 n=1 Tax=Sabethes cyaneus TaxID=53552 RepID=UPI00237E55E5|nr:uncharacterized protein LOC128732815 [Sabethes cyaneus]